MPIDKQSVIKQYAAHEKDTGSPSVQIALLSSRITLLTEHLNKHKKDFSSRRSLLKFAGERRKLLKYLNRTDAAAHAKVLSELKIRGN